jgi:hypothetical protein
MSTLVRVSISTVEQEVGFEFTRRYQRLASKSKAEILKAASALAGAFSWHRDRFLTVRAIGLWRAGAKPSRVKLDHPRRFNAR